MLVAVPSTTRQGSTKFRVDESYIVQPKKAQRVTSGRRCINNGCKGTEGKLTTQLASIPSSITFDLNRLRHEQQAVGAPRCPPTVLSSAQAAIPPTLEVGAADGSSATFELQAVVMHHDSVKNARRDSSAWRRPKDDHALSEDANHGHYTLLRKGAQNEFIMLDDNVNPRTIPLEDASFNAVQLVYTNTHLGTRHIAPAIASCPETARNDDIIIAHANAERAERIRLREAAAEAASEEARRAAAANVAAQAAAAAASAGRDAAAAAAANAAEGAPPVRRHLRIGDQVELEHGFFINGNNWLELNNQPAHKCSECKTPGHNRTTCSQQSIVTIVIAVHTGTGESENIPQSYDVKYRQRHIFRLSSDCAETRYKPPGQPNVIRYAGMAAAPNVGDNAETHRKAQGATSGSSDTWTFELVDKLKRQPKLKFAPANLNANITRCYTDILRAANNSRAKVDLLRSYLFNEMVLQKPPKLRGGRNVSDAAKKRNRPQSWIQRVIDVFTPSYVDGMRIFDDDAINNLMHERLNTGYTFGHGKGKADAAKARKRSVGISDADAQQRIRRAQEHASFGHWSMAVRALCRGDAAPVNDANEQLMRDKHPPPLPRASATSNRRPSADAETQSNATSTLPSEVPAAGADVVADDTPSQAATIIINQDHEAGESGVLSQASTIVNNLSAQSALTSIVPGVSGDGVVSRTLSGSHSSTGPTLPSEVPADGAVGEANDIPAAGESGELSQANTTINGHSTQSALPSDVPGESDDAEASPAPPVDAGAHAGGATTADGRRALDEKLAEDDFNLYDKLREIVNQIPSSADVGTGCMPIIALKQCIKDDDLHEEFVQHIRHWLYGTLCNDPVTLAQLTGGDLFGILKKDGGIRPITCGMMTRRIAGRVITALARPEMEETFKKLQKGVGAPNGATRITNNTAYWFEQRKNADDWVAMKIDFTNAFNNVSRVAFSDAVDADFLWMKPMVDMLYGAANTLRFGDRRLSAQEGCFQGCSLSSFLFSLVLQPIIERIQEECDLDINLWFLDDGIIAGKAEEVRKAISIIDSEMARAVGLFRNPAKCEVIFTGGNTNAANVRVAPTAAALPGHTDADGLMPFADAVGVPAHQVHTDGCFDLLGVPHGTPQHCAAFIRKHAVDKNTETLGKIALVEHWQTRAGMSRYSAGYCKFVYLMRGTKPSPDVKAAFADATISTKEAWGRNGVEMDGSTWDQMQLGICNGGVGARDPARHHIAAYWACLSECMRVDGWRFDDAILQPLADEYNDAIDPECVHWVANHDHAQRMGLITFEGAAIEGAGFKPLSTDPEQKRSQSELSLWIDYTLRRKLQRFWESDDINDEDRIFHQRRLREKQAHGANAWLLAIPQRGSGLRMPNEVFADAFRAMFGLNRFAQAGHDCPECVAALARNTEKDRRNPEGAPKNGRKKPDKITRRGGHAVTCPCGGDRIQRHDALAEVLQQGFNAAGFRTKMEQRIHGQGKERPGDVLALFAGDLVRANQDQSVTKVHIAVDAAVTYTGRSNTPICSPKGDHANVSDPSHLADVYARRKDDKSKASVEADGLHRFIPVVITANGAINTAGIRLLRNIGRAIGAGKGNLEAVRRSQAAIFMRLSVALQTANYGMTFRRRHPEARTRADHASMFLAAPINDEGSGAGRLLSRWRKQHPGCNVEPRGAALRKRPPPAPVHQRSSAVIKVTHNAPQRSTARWAGLRVNDHDGLLVERSEAGRLVTRQTCPPDREHADVNLAADTGSGRPVSIPSHVSAARWAGLRVDDYDDILVSVLGQCDVSRVISRPA
jgi:hypothetical protein